MPRSYAILIDAGFLKRKLGSQQSPELAARLRAIFARWRQALAQYTPRPTVTNALPHTAQCLSLGRRAAASSRPASELESVMGDSYNKGEAGHPCPYPRSLTRRLPTSPVR